MHDREADLTRASLSAASNGASPSLDVPLDVLDHHDGIVHHEAHRDRRFHQRQANQAVAETAMTPKVTISEISSNGRNHRRPAISAGIRK